MTSNYFNPVTVCSVTDPDLTCTILTDTDMETQCRSGAALLISFRHFLQTVPRKKTSILLRHPSIISISLLFTLIGLSLPVRLLSFWLPGSLPHGKHLRLSAMKLSMLVRDIPWLRESGVSRQLFQTAWRLWKSERNCAFIYFIFLLWTVALWIDEKKWNGLFI